jgi:hypothetical protein
MQAAYCYKEPAPDAFHSISCRPGILLYTIHAVCLPNVLKQQSYLLIQNIAVVSNDVIFKIIVEVNDIKFVIRYNKANIAVQFGFPFHTFSCSSHSFAKFKIW